MLCILLITAAPPTLRTTNGVAKVNTAVCFGATTLNCVVPEIVIKKVTSVTPSVLSSVHDVAVERMSSQFNAHTQESAFTRELALAATSPAPIRRNQFILLHGDCVGVIQ